MKKTLKETNRKNKMKSLLVILYYSLFALIGIILIYYFFPQSSGDCLEEFAKNYCENENMTFYERTDIYNFYCSSEDNERLNGRKLNTVKYYFFESEREQCKIKEAWSFKKIK